MFFVFPHKTVCICLLCSFSTDFFSEKDTITFTVAAVLWQVTRRGRWGKVHLLTDCHCVPKLTLSFIFFPSTFGQIRNKFDYISIERLLFRNAYQKNFKQHRIKMV